MKTKLLILASVILLTITSCTDPDGAKKCLEQNNYKNIEIGGYGWFAGSKDDFYVTKFKALAPNGTPCDGVVTKGFWFKGSTIRLND